MIDLALPDVYAALARTPATLRASVGGLPEPWLRATDGPGTWSAHDVVAHLLDGEHVDWMPRLGLILAHGEARPFDPYDREGSRARGEGHSAGELLDAFEQKRRENVAALRALDLGPDDLARTGMHPDLGRTTVRQLLATWVAHDHGHLVQIHRTLARQYGHEVGPWRAYLSVFVKRTP